MFICFDASIHTECNYTQMVVEAIIEINKNPSVKASGVKMLLESLDSDWHTTLTEDCLYIQFFFRLMKKNTLQTDQT